MNRGVKNAPINVKVLTLERLLLSNNEKKFKLCIQLEGQNSYKIWK